MMFVHDGEGTRRPNPLLADGLMGKSSGILLPHGWHTRIKVIKMNSKGGLGFRYDLSWFKSYTL